MNLVDMYEYIQKLHEEHEDTYYCIGLRFENKEREVGEKMEWSRHNPDREDERDFPQYGSEAYGTLPELDGTSAWDLDSGARYPGLAYGDIPSYFDPYGDCNKPFLTQ